MAENVADRLEPIEKPVEQTNAMTAGQQSWKQRGTDVAGAADYQHCPLGRFFPKTRKIQIGAAGNFSFGVEGCH